MVNNLIGHVLAYYALGWRVSSDKQGGAGSPGQVGECNSSLDECSDSIAAIMASLLSPASFLYFRGLVGSQADNRDGQKSFFYRCECCGELTCAREVEWGNAQILLELGAANSLLAVHITSAGLEWWLEQLEMSDDSYSATVHVADEWYVLFRCDPEHYNLSGLLAPGVRVISNGERITLPPSLDDSGEYSAWVDLPIALKDVPAWIVERLAVREVA